MNRRTARYGIADLISMFVKILAPVINAYKDETTSRKVVAVPVAAPAPEPVVAAPAPVAEVKAVFKPVALVVIPEPIALTVLPMVLTVSKPSKATSKPRKATKTATPKKNPTKKPEAPGALYRKSKRGDRYEVAVNPKPGECLYTKTGRRYALLALSKEVA